MPGERRTPATQFSTVGGEGAAEMSSRTGLSKKKQVWQYPETTGVNPSERWGHSACSFNGIVYGCCGGMHMGDVHVLDPKKMSWRTLSSTGNGPGPRDSHSAVVAEDSMIIFGGTNGRNKLNDLHMLDLNSNEWSRPGFSGSPPPARESHTASIVGGDTMVVFGGSGEGESNYLNDVHTLNLRSMRWDSPAVSGNLPVPRDSHTAVAVGRRLLVYGGDSGHRHLGDVDIFDLRTLTWSKVVINSTISPGIRAGHASVLFTNSGSLQMYVIGGVGEDHYYNDVWVLDLDSSSWTQLTIPGPQPQGRFSHTATIGNTADIIVYGGCGEDERPLSELLVFQINPEDPTSRSKLSLESEHSRSKRRRVSFASEIDKEQIAASPIIELNNLIGAEIRCRVNATFESGCLMTAIINGNLFRGVLFAPDVPFVSPTRDSYANNNSGFNSGKSSQELVLGKKPRRDLSNFRDDLRGVFLTLGTSPNHEDDDLAYTVV